ncbi:hypothetical protein KVR01_012783 [Diaporthe batatas]|uniref:uncharacterized protein n=1 Tax=Diaporthe batatas TaxID=748121 RepID=UPI001D0412A7|nr:uncharacterized protein KVR01_012783 [Diaporthe batatas]KAG8157399.1 hypothetical protein KVR01_012783 [Diaporthe batatas]
MTGTNPTRGKLEHDAIAIVGLSCRLPGEASNPEKFWELMVNARSAYSETSKRWNTSGFHDAADDRPNACVAQGGHFLDQDPSAFDATFFHISQQEAAAMDPQQRLMLELSYEAFENAGIKMDHLSGSSTGCYVGVMGTDWRESFSRDPEAVPKYAYTGSGTEFVSSRVSWFYNLTGPCMTINTACSSSLVALHLACQSLRTGECESALVGGVNLMINPDLSCHLSGQKFLAGDGRCKTFDATADGYGRGEGCAALVLKRASDAIRDGCSIRAIVRATGVNQDGKTKSITLPSQDAQASLIRSTYKLAGLEPGEASYFETHGTGTKAGDPLELGAVYATMGILRQEGDPLYLGAVKPNIGHGEAVAGLSAVIKCVLMLEKDIIPPTIAFSKLNPAIPFQKWRLEVPRTSRPWPSTKATRVLSVNGFGAGGTNAHIILESIESYLRRPGLKNVCSQDFNGNHILTQSGHSVYSLSRPHLFMVASQDKEGIQRQKELLRQHVQNLPEELGKDESYLSRLAFTLNHHRSQLTWMSYAIGTSTEQLAESLQDPKCLSFRPNRSQRPRIGFVFTGQGAQWARMGAELLMYDVFSNSIKAADRYFTQELGCPWSALKELLCQGSSSNINDPVYAQPLATVLQVALVELLASWNITPSSIVGHSSGEIAGAFCAGAISREDAWKIAYSKGEVLKNLTGPPGAMMAVSLSEEEAQAYIDKAASKGRVAAACINSPSSVTLSGDTAAINEIQEQLKAEGLFQRRLLVGFAYHSHHMELIAGEFYQGIEDIQIVSGGDATTIPMYSSLTGELADPSHLASPDYWVANVVSPVRFSQAASKLANVGVDILLEVGPHCALKSPIAQILKSCGLSDIDYRSVLYRGMDAADSALQCAGSLVAQSVPVNIEALNGNQRTLTAGFRRPITNLHPYAWNHTRTYWAEPPLNRDHRLRSQPRRDLIGAPVSPLSASERVWRGFLRISDEPWIEHHRVQSAIIYPAAGFLAMAIEGARQLADPGLTVKQFRIRDFELKNAGLIPENDELETTLTMKPKASDALLGATGWLHFSVSSRRADQDFRQNCHGLVKIEYGKPGSVAVPRVTDAQQGHFEREFRRIEQQCSEVQDEQYLYKDLHGKGLNFGPKFRTLSEIRRGKDVSLCTITIPTSGSNFTSKAPEERPHIVHPVALDGLVQCFFAATIGRNGSLKAGMVPRRMNEVTVDAKLPYQAGTRFRACAAAYRHGLQQMRSDAVALNEATEEPVMTIQGLYWTPIQDLAAAPARKSLCYNMSWQPLFPVEPSLGDSDGTNNVVVNGAIRSAPNGTVLKGPPHGNGRDIFLIGPEDLEPASEHFITNLSGHLSKNFGCRVQRLTFGRVPCTSDLRNKRCIFLELSKPFLETPDSSEFAALKRYILDSLDIHWITVHDGPGAGLVTGFARTLRNEMPDLTFRALNCTEDTVSDTTEAALNIISQFVTEQDPSEDEHADSEFRLRGGRLEVCRVRESVELNDEIHDMASGRVAPVAIKDVTTDLMLGPQAIGSLDGLRFEAVRESGVALADDEVEIEVKATGLNFRDVLTVIGEIPDDHVGREAAGVVLRKGATVARFKLGDRVCCLAPGAHRTRLRVSEKLCQDMGQMSHQDAASLPLVFCTAYHALVNLARLRPGQSVLIHAAAGGVGQAALQVARHLQLEIFATVGSAEKRELVTTHYGVSDDHVFSSRDLTFRAGVMAVTGGRGVDCVLNSLAGEALAESWHCLAPFGTFVEIGMKDILSNSALDMRPFGNNATFCFFNLELMERIAPDMLAGILGDVCALIRQGSLKPVTPVMRYPVSQVEGAFRLMQAGKHRGKIVLDFEKRSSNETIPMAKSIHAVARLSPEATYVLVGGLGGLGRSLSTLLVSQGARNLCFLSRSGAASPEAKSLVERLKSGAVRTKVIRCNVADEAELEAAMKECARDMPPIKGVIQAAMVLRDAVFEGMTHTQWEQSLRPKVRGSWNLHKVLPQDIDFFVMLSSFSGIFGNRGQANYAAGCTFQDELARFRHRQGLKAASIDLGAMADVGVLAEKGAAGDIASWIEHFGIREEELHTILVLSIARQASGDWAAENPQLVTGLATGEAASQAGVWPQYLDEPKFSLIAQHSGQQGDRALASADSPGAKLAQAESMAEAVHIVVSGITATLSKSLQMPSEDVDVSRPLYFYGVDSLVAIEMRNWVIKEFKSDVSLFDILAQVPIAQLAESIAKGSKAFRGEAGEIS